LILHFQSEYGVALIAVEGSSHAMDLTLFKNYPNQEALKQVMNEYHNRGELPGSVSAAMFSDYPSLYHGIETWEDYEAGALLYLQTMAEQARVEAELKRVKDILDASIEQTYSKEQREFP